MANSTGERIRVLRNERGLSQTALGDCVGCSLRSISAIERGESQPTANQLRAISVFFGVTIDYLLHGTSTGATKVESEIIKMIREDRALYQSLIEILNAKKRVNDRLTA